MPFTQRTEVGRVEARRGSWDIALLRPQSTRPPRAAARLAGPILASMLLALAVVAALRVDLASAQTFVPGTQARVTADGDTLRMRAGVGLDKPVIASIPDGSIVNIKAVFPFTNKPGEPFEPADLEPGTEVSIGRYDAGTQINFFVVNDGGRQNDPSVFEGGRFEARNPRTGEIAKITDFGGDTQIVHIAEDGTETILKARALYGADASQQTTNNNRLNFDGEGHVVSGWDDATGSLVFGFEDSYRANKDNDFNDDVYAVRFGSVTERFAFLVGEDAAAGLGASITDPDSARMEYARVVLKEGFDGDVLTLPDQILLGTNIKLHFQTDGDLRFSGVDSIANYEKVISSIGLEVDGESVAAGDRVITAMVRDTEGNPSNTARTVVDLTDRLIAGDDGDNVLIGNSRHNQEDVAAGDDTMAGRGGNDHLNGQSGNDFLDGGEGRDLLEGKLGNDILNGGAGQDVLVGGKGADEFRYTGLSDGTDLIRDFNANEGDVLGLGILFRDTDLDLSKIDQFVRLEARALDSDERANDLAVQVDLDGGAADGCHRFVTIFEMQNPTGVNADTDVLSILTLQQNVQPS